MSNPAVLGSSAPAASMSDDEVVKAAWSELTLVLSFYSRIDTKLSVVLGLDLGMVAVLFTRLPARPDVTPVHLLLGLIFTAVLGRSMYGLWKGAFPHLEGGTNSLVYFRSICRMSEASFVTSFVRQTPLQLSADLLEQAWRNSKILVAKFEALRTAYVWVIVAAGLWAALLYVLPDSPRAR